MENKKLSIITVIILICIFAISSLFLCVEKYSQNSSSAKNTFSPGVEPTPSPTADVTPSPKYENKKPDYSVYFNGNKLFEDGSGKLYYTIIGESEEDFNPEITVLSSFEGFKASFSDGVITKGKIENNIPVKITICSENYYEEKEVTVTTLPIININTSSEITEEDCDVKFYLFGNTDPRLREITSDAAMRIRGGSTKLFPKKGYKLSLTKKKNGIIKNNKISLLGMRSDDDWVLYAAYNDSEKVKNVFCSNLWYDSCAENNLFRITNGYEYRFTELFINGNYCGLYAIGYHMDAKQSGIKEIYDGMFDEFLFKKADWTCELEELLSSDKLTDYELKNGDECKNEEDGFAALADYYRLIAEAVSVIESNGKDSVKNKEIIEKLYNCCDIGNAVDVYLFFIFVIAEDNTKDGPFYPSEDDSFAGIKNIYIAFKKDGDGYKVVFTPWDLDLTWGNHYSDGEINDTGKYDYPGYYPMIEMKLSPVYLLLEAGDENIAVLLRERLGELLRSSWSEENLLNLACSLENDIFDSGAFLRDKECWPDGNYVEPEQKLTCLKNDISNRCSFISGYLEELIEEHK